MFTSLLNIKSNRTTTVLHKINICNDIHRAIHLVILQVCRMSEQCEFKQYLIFEPWVQVTFTILYTLIAVAGVVGRKHQVLS